MTLLICQKWCSLVYVDCHGYNFYFWIIYDLTYDFILIISFNLFIILFFVFCLFFP